ncbi:hypothetical protein Agub_g14911 [Astrephomene gubernaculifera]|uniref:EGF-like domain-containing protein n=1 Tax=Astrephomene gubernaculifera TaxID=47775 RepID=A0AAD3HSP3_9CHLO|nr:hypothetical protein Agub_g14911 [Astrephomene gubernaculifera]
MSGKRYRADAIASLAAFLFAFMNLELAYSGPSRNLLGFSVPKVKHILPSKQYIIANNTARANAQFRDTGYWQAGSGTVGPDGVSRRRCAVARGTWCGPYSRQTPISTRPVPRGSKECPNKCSGWGNCNYDSGKCECPAGRGGPDCGQEVKRPCSNRYRHPHEHDVDHAVGHIGPDKHDLNPFAPGWLASRCYGYCVDDLALCVCGHESKYRHIPAPPGSPPWTPPVQWGRPTVDGCMIGTHKDGRRLDWGLSYLKYEDVYGPDGWCNKEDPTHHCGCVWDGNAWPCDGSRRYEAFCVNQCTGHGDCHMGYCRCHPGWYGLDCSRKQAGAELEEGRLGEPWLQEVVVVPPASLPTPPTPTRPRPLIYVYDMPTEYTSKMLQYRLGVDSCLWRRYTEQNTSLLLSTTYAVEIYLHEMMLQSEHRTFDPEEADYFYVPMYITCFMWPVLGWADHPWWHAPYAHSRPMHVANMILEAHQWLSTSFPWWNRRGGRDHIWLMAHDEGACYMPTVVYNTSIILTHWGRMDLEHTSGSAYDQDNYHEPMKADTFHGWKGFDWVNKTTGHPCYNPEKDLVIPAFKPPDRLRHSPLLNGLPLVRDIMLYFRGDIGAGRQNHYSRGIRQKLFKLAHDGDWATKHRIYIGTGETLPGDYSEHLSRSKFCLVAPGDGWSPRAEDAILHGCVPLVVMDGVHAVFESLLDWESFSLRIRESALEAVPELLEGVAPERLARLQRNLARVWHRFAYATGPVLRQRYKFMSDSNDKDLPRDVREGLAKLPPRETPFQPVREFAFEDDAFSTIMQWLYHRINETR